MRIEREITIPYQDIEFLFYTVYGYEIDALDLLFGCGNYRNDCYKKLYLEEWEEEDLDIEYKDYINNDYKDYNKIIKVLREELKKEGIEEDYILIEICW